MAPFQRGAFFAPLNAWSVFSLPARPKERRPCPSLQHGLFFHNQILFKGGPQIETEKQTADTCLGRQKAQSQVLPCEGRLLCIPKFYNLLKIRNGVETVPSILRRIYHTDRMPVRGLISGRFFFGCKIGALNFKKLFTYRKGLGHYAENLVLVW